MNQRERDDFNERCNHQEAIARNPAFAKAERERIAEENGLERDENGFPIELNESVGNVPRAHYTEIVEIPSPEQLLADKDLQNLIEKLTDGQREYDANAPVSYAAAQLSIDQALRQLIVLSGDEMGPSNKAWQDIASGAIINLSVLAEYLRQQLRGSPFPCFPEVRIDETNPQSA